ncbi:MAG: hypothetical protein POG74_02505 [Acidocella sp.]|nr:hypothetical protein [Acidocella sp.]
MSVGGLLGGFVGVVGGMQPVRMRQMGMVGGDYMFMFFRKLGGFMMMMGRPLMMHGGVGVVILGGVSHGVFL